MCDTSAGRCFSTQPRLFRKPSPSQTNDTIFYLIAAGTPGSTFNLLSFLETKG